MMIKFIFLFSAVFYVGLALESQITRAMKEFKIIPQLISSDVPELLKITYDNGIFVNMGNEISAYQARNQPKVDWKADKNSTYLFVALDIDAPSSEDRSISAIITWMVGNIPGKDIDSGENRVSYIPLAAPKGTGLHRAVFLVYEQPGKLKFDEKPVDAYTYEGRHNFSLKDFVAKYGLLGPVAANFYLTKYDEYVLKIYKQLNCCSQFNQ